MRHAGYANHLVVDFVIFRYVSHHLMREELRIGKAWQWDLVVVNQQLLSVVRMTYVDVHLVWFLSTCFFSIECYRDSVLVSALCALLLSFLFEGTIRLKIYNRLAQVYNLNQAIYSYNGLCFVSSSTSVVCTSLCCGCSFVYLQCTYFLR